MGRKPVKPLFSEEIQKLLLLKKNDKKISEQSYNAYKSRLNNLIRNDIPINFTLKNATETITKVKNMSDGR